MALSKERLKQNFLSIMEDAKAQGTPFKAAAAWAGAYDSYAKQAQDVSGDSVLLTNRFGFQAALSFSPSSSPLVAALQYQAAFIAYWTGGLFSIGRIPSLAAKCISIPPFPIWQNEITSAVIVALPGLGLLLTPIFLDNKTTDLDARAGKLANAFHTATTTLVTVLITGLTIPQAGPIPPLPVTNICTLS